MEGPIPSPSSTIIGRAIRVALAATLFFAGCANSIGTTARSFLNKVEQSPDPNIRYLAYQKLASPNCYDNEEQKDEAARVLVAALDSKKEPTASRAAICRTLAALKRPEARTAILKAIEDPDPTLRTEACRALGQVGRPEDWTLLARIMATDASIDCRVAAVESIGDLKPKDSRVAITLVEGMEDTDPAIRLASLRGLRTLTGQDLGPEPGPWKKYAQAQAGQSDTVRR